MLLCTLQAGDSRKLSSHCKIWNQKQIRTCTELTGKVDIIKIWAELDILGKNNAFSSQITWLRQLLCQPIQAAKSHWKLLFVLNIRLSALLFRWPTYMIHCVLTNLGKQLGHGRWHLSLRLQHTSIHIVLLYVGVCVVRVHSKYHWNVHWTSYIPNITEMYNLYHTSQILLKFRLHKLHLKYMTLTSCLGINFKIKMPTLTKYI